MTKKKIKIEDVEYKAYQCSSFTTINTMGEAFCSRGHVITAEGVLVLVNFGYDSWVTKDGIRKEDAYANFEIIHGGRSHTRYVNGKKFTPNSASRMANKFAREVCGVS